MSMIGKYEIIKRLGEGYFGETYLAVDVITRQMVALKVYKQLKGALDAAKKDILPLLVLEHSNIVKYIEWNFYGVDEIVYVATEYAEEGTLRDYFSVDKERKLSWLIELVDAIGYIHSKGIIHRDLKPENIFISHGHLKVGDFGIAIFSSGSFYGEIIGTPCYMAPEQYLHRKVSPRTDIWSIGVIIYELAFNRLPFQDLEECIHNEPNYNLPGDKRLIPIIKRCLAKKETERYVSCADLKRALSMFELIVKENVMKVVQGMVGWEWDGKGYNYREFKIEYPQFPQTPVIVTTLHALDIGTAPNDTTQRWWVMADNITTTSAIIKIGAWNGNMVFGAKIVWTAMA